MKQLLIAALVAVSLLTTAFTPEPNKISRAAVDNFKVDFKGATNAEWTQRPDFVKVAFSLNNEQVEAFYNYDGQVLATCRQIGLNDLPVNAKRTFAKRYNGYTVKEAIKYEAPDETSFYISADNDKESLIVKVSESGQVGVFQKKKVKQSQLSNLASAF